MKRNYSSIIILLSIKQNGKLNRSYVELKSGTKPKKNWDKKTVKAPRGYRVKPVVQREIQKKE